MVHKIEIEIEDEKTWNAICAISSATDLTLSKTMSVLFDINHTVEKYCSLIVKESEILPIMKRRGMDKQIEHIQDMLK